MQRTSLILVAVIALGALTLGIVLAFSDTRTATGSVNATAGSTDLYICEGSRTQPGPQCVQDDMGADEDIFEGLEDLLPGRVSHWDIRIKNVGTTAWDVLTAAPQITIASDPGGDCLAMLTGSPAFGFVQLLGRAPDSTSIVGTLGNLGSRPMGVAANRTTNRVYVSRLFSDSVTVIDGVSNTVLGTVSVGSYPRSISINEKSNRVYVANSNGGSVSVIDGGSNAVITTINVGTGPTGLAVNPITNRIYVGVGYSNVLKIIDGNSNLVVDTLSVGTSPNAVAVNPATNRIYVTTSSGLAVVDGATNDTTYVPGAPEATGGVAVNSATNRVYVPHSTGLAVIDGSTDTVLTSVPLVQPAAAVSIDPETNTIYTVGQESVTVLNGSSNEIITTIAKGIGAEFSSAAVNPNTGWLYASNWQNDSVSVLGTTLNDNHAPIGNEQSFLGNVGIHVEPAGYEDLRLHVGLPFASPSGCSDTTWNVSFPITVQIHSP